MKIVVLGGNPDSLTRFRGPLIGKMVELGHRVTAMAGSESETSTCQLKTLGAAFESFPLQRKGTGLQADLATCLYLTRRFKELKPDLVFAYTVKPVVWGGLACRLARVPAFHALITGLGEQFDTSSVKRRLLGTVISTLYKGSLKQATTVIFQNDDDKLTLISRGCVSPERAYKINGSGVDLTKYHQQPLPPGPPVFLTMSRLIIAKGLRELAAAAKIVKKRHPDVVFRLACVEESGPNAIPLSEVQDWDTRGIIEYLGQVPDAVQPMQSSHVYILPSYYGEGVPRTILEAMAIGRPVISTNNVGCRDAVADGFTGKLIESRSVDALVSCITWYLENSDQWPVQAKAGRQRAEQLYDVNKVNESLLRIMQLA